MFAIAGGVLLGWLVFAWLWTTATGQEVLEWVVRVAGALLWLAFVVVLIVAGYAVWQSLR